MAARSKNVRQNASILENLDSDQSLSDEEELQDAIFEFDCSKNLPSLYSHEKKEKDEQPRFPFTHAAVGAKRRYYNNLEKETQQEACEWSIILNEADKLADLHKKACKSFNPLLEERRYHKGGRGSSRVKFSFRSLSSKEDFSSKDETHNFSEEDIEGHAEWDHFEHPTKEDTAPKLIENVLEESAELADTPGFHKQRLAGASSVSELLEDMQKTDPSLGRTLAVDNIREKERQNSSSKRSLLYLGNRVLDNKDALEFIGDISSEDERINQDYQPAQIVKEQTMTDLFQEAFNTSTDEGIEIPRSNNYGFHGRLQHVIKLEKERHMEYSKGLQIGRTPSNESNCIIVRILSRTVEAKLTVCQCLFGETSKNLECEKGLLKGFGNGGTLKKTIIFSPTFCNNVELEVGSIVCIHQPWKEVQVNGGEIIILCTYFSKPL